MTDFNNPEYTKLLNEVKVFRAFDLEVPNDDSVRVVAWLANGKPAIVEKKVGSGLVFLYVFPATTAWTNLPTKFAFPILMQRAANMLTLGNRSPKNLPVASPISGLVSLADQTATVKITPPMPGSRREMRPEQTPDGRALFSYAETDRAGFYDVLIDRTPKVTMTYALNSNTDIESNLQAITPENLKQDYPDFNFSFVSKPEDLQTKLQAERQGTELWPWLMFAVFALLASESVLSNRWAPRN
jgi:hypothetical protein